MDQNNISGITVEDLLDESDFSEVSSVATNLKQILDKIKSLEIQAKVAQNTGQSGAGSSSSGFQIGEKFGELKGKMDGMNEKIEVLRIENVGLKEGMAKMKEEFEGKIAKKDRQMREMKDEIAKLGQKNVNLKADLERKGREMAEMLDEIRELKAANEVGKTEFDGLKEENRKLKKEIGAKNREFEGQIVGLEKEKKKLVREFGEIKAEKAEKLANLSEKIAELEARTKFDVIKMDGNKWNSAQCGRKIAISEGGLVVTHTGPDGNYNSVRDQSPIPKFSSNAKNGSIAYFEVEILQIYSNLGGLYIGFCTQQFQLEGKLLGNEQNSIRMCGKNGMEIDGTNINFNNACDYFQAGDVVGIGIAHFSANSTMKCLASCNGQFLGMANLPIKFASLELFPAIGMYYDDDSIRGKFASGEWKYNPLELVQNMR